MVMRSRVTGAAQRGTGRRAEAPVEDESLNTIVEGEDQTEVDAPNPDAQAGDEDAVPPGISRRGAVRTPGANTRVPRGTAPEPSEKEVAEGPTVAKRRGPAPAAKPSKKGGKGIAGFSSAAEVKAAMKSLDGEVKETIAAHNERMKELRSRHAELASHLFDHTSR